MADSNSILPAWGCNICLEESQNPVCTPCGHLFCWPCLYRWVHDMAKPCPVCRSSLTLHSGITPVYVTTRAEAPEAANAAATIPPRPRPRAPTTSAPYHESNAVHLYRETVDHVRRQEAAEHARVAGEEEVIAQMQFLIDTDVRTLSRLRRGLKELRRSNRGLVVSSAVSGTGHDQLASTRNSLSHGVVDPDIDRARGTESVLRRFLNTISVGRRYVFDHALDHVE